MSDTILKLEDITKIYPNGTVANRNINIELRKGEIHSIVVAYPKATSITIMTEKPTNVKRAIQSLFSLVWLSGISSSTTT